MLVVWLVSIANCDIVAVMKLILLQMVVVFVDNYIIRDFGNHLVLM